MGIVKAEDCGAVKGDLVDELQKDGLDLIKVPVMVQMLQIDIGDHLQYRREFQKGAVRFIGLGHQEFALAKLGVTAAQDVDLAADDHCGVQPGMGQDPARHRGGGGLAVAAGHRDPEFLQPHQLGQHLGPGDHRHMGRAGRHDLRVVLLDCRGVDHHVGVLKIFRRMADPDHPPKSAEPLGDRAQPDVGAAYLVAEVEEHLGDAAHADAADADEMNFFGFFVH